MRPRTTTIRIEVDLALVPPPMRLTYAATARRSLKLVQCKGNRVRVRGCSKLYHSPQELAAHFDWAAQERRDRAEDLEGTATEVWLLDMAGYCAVIAKLATTDERFTRLWEPAS